VQLTPRPLEPWTAPFREQRLFKRLKDPRGDGLCFVRTDSPGEAGWILMGDRERVKGKLRGAVRFPYRLEGLVARGPFLQLARGDPTLIGPNCLNDLEAVLQDHIEYPFAAFQAGAKS